MITIFSTPKKFEGHIKVIQTNAIKSWTLLEPKCEVILFGKEQGTAEIAEKLNIRHIPDVKTNEFGTPLVNHMFADAEKIASFPVLAYVNSDIILCRDFTRAAGRIKMKKFLLVARRWNVRIDEYIDFNDKEWDKKICMKIREGGSIGAPTGIDLFVFTKGIWKGLPPFAIGRASYDPKLLYFAYCGNVPLVNISPAAKAIHQNHTYSHHPHGKNGVYYGEEARRNKQLIKNGITNLCIRNASFILTKCGCLPALTLGHLQAVLRTLPYRVKIKSISRFLRFIKHAGDNSFILKKLEHLDI
ncbi:MAG: hypothetical protein JW957_03350 [Candidatus Omnitrophica bacterium]|nr:hypothetical protein [Candidatus Omnitrophota bacterium]